MALNWTSRPAASVVGHTGSGKTTLLSLLLRYYESPPGRSIDGHLAAIDDDDYRQAVGLVLQDPFVPWLPAPERTSPWAGPSGGGGGGAGRARRRHP